MTRYSSSRSRSRDRDRSRSRNRESGDEGFRVHVSDLGIDTSQKDLEKAFSKFGDYHEVWLARNPPCFAFVVYKHKDDAEEAIREMNGEVVGGQRIKCSWARPRVRGGRSNGGRDSGRFTMSDMRCYQCGERGHFSRNCPSRNRSSRYSDDDDRRNGRRNSRRSRSRSRSNSRHRRRRYSRSYSRSRSRSRSRRRRDSRDRDRSRSRDDRRRRRSRSNSRRRDRSRSNSRHRDRSRSRSNKRRRDSRSYSRDRKRVDNKDSGKVAVLEAPALTESVVDNNIVEGMNGGGQAKETKSASRSASRERSDSILLNGDEEKYDPTQENEEDENGLNENEEVEGSYQIGEDE